MASGPRLKGIALCERLYLGAGTEVLYRPRLDFLDRNVCGSPGGRTGGAARRQAASGAGRRADTQEARASVAGVCLSVSVALVIHSGVAGQPSPASPPVRPPLSARADRGACGLSTVRAAANWLPTRALPGTHTHADTHAHTRAHAHTPLCRQRDRRRAGPGNHGRAGGCSASPRGSQPTRLDWLKWPTHNSRTTRQRTTTKGRPATTNTNKRHDDDGRQTTTQLLFERRHRRPPPTAAQTSSQRSFLLPSRLAASSPLLTASPPRPLSEPSQLPWRLDAISGERHSAGPPSISPLAPFDLATQDGLQP